MPTGYTDKVLSGEIIAFKDFAMLCARAFGACIEMRDAPMDEPIPDEFKPSNYHQDKIDEAREELSRLKAMTTDQKESAARSQNETELASWKERERKKDEARKRYSDMIAAATAWEPPTPEHVGLKDFMIQQLTDSLEWDCDPNPRPAPMARDEWFSKSLENAEWWVNRREKSQQEEIERAKNRTEWVRALRLSLSE